MFYFILKILDYTSSYNGNTTIVSTYTGSTRVFHVDFRYKSLLVVTVPRICCEMWPCYVDTI